MFQHLQYYQHRVITVNCMLSRSRPLLLYLSQFWVQLSKNVLFSRDFMFCRKPYIKTKKSFSVHENEKSFLLICFVSYWQALTCWPVGETVENSVLPVPHFLQKLILPQFIKPTCRDEHKMWQHIMKPSICWFCFCVTRKWTSCCPVVLEILKVSELRWVRKEGMLGMGLGPWWFCFIFQFGHHLGMYIFHFPPTPAKLIGDDPTISNLAFVPILLVLIKRFH